MVKEGVSEREKRAREEQNRNCIFLLGDYFSWLPY